MSFGVFNLEISRLEAEVTAVEINALINSVHPIRTMKKFVLA